VFNLDLDKDEFVILKVMQQGVDLQITTYDANGEKIADFDTPNGTDGPELVQLTTSAKGAYKIEVYPYNKEAFEGDYEIKLQLLEPIASSKEGKVDQAFSAYRNNDGPGASVAIQQNGNSLFKRLWSV